MRQKRRDIEDLNYSKSNLERRLQETMNDLSVKQTECMNLRTALEDMNIAAVGTNAKLASCQLELEKSKDKVRFSLT